MSTFETLTFYRGVSAKYPTDRAYVMTPRSDRRPKNSSLHFHQIADNWFRSHFGIAYRSEGVFVMSKIVSATAYAATPDHVVRIVPLSKYQYCWSPQISDLLFAANRMADSPANDIESYLDTAEYREDGLQEAYDSGNEVMLHCERYIAIPLDLVEGVTGPNTQAIILPS